MNKNARFQGQQNKWGHTTTLLQHLPKRPLEYTLVILLTHPTIIHDLIALVKAIRGC